jgi:Flp pilus assembly secretin CpaC
MGNTSLIRTALLIALLTAFGFAATGRAPAADRAAPAGEPRPPVVTVVEAQQAFDIASRLVDDSKKVVNGIAVHGRDQVMLKVTVAEVQRDVIKQLGIDLNGSVGFGSAVLNFNNTNPFPVYGQALVHSRAGVIRTLAEPNLTAISGENATFMAGGECPIPAGFEKYHRGETTQTISPDKDQDKISDLGKV